MTKEALFEKARLLPLTPGVYIMKSSAGKVIYVGKSKALRNRVSSYFASYAKHNLKTKKMVANVFDFEVYHTKTELEALILENQFIKQFMPRYNIKLKDSSDYPYIELKDGEYPSFSVVYRRKEGGYKYFGPYSSVSVAYSILGAAKKAFRLPDCNRMLPQDIGKGRPCLNHHLGQCMAPCIEGQVSREEYLSAVQSAVRFLGGDYAFLIKELEQKMQAASEELDFERAAKLRDSMNYIKKTGDRQHIVGSLHTVADVVGIYSDELGSAVTVFFIRNGAISDRESFFFSADELFDSGSFTSFLFRFYTNREFIPRELYLSLPLEEEDKALLCSHFSVGAKLRIITPQKGDRRELVLQAENNAKNLLFHKRESESKTERFLSSLAAFLCLEVLPQRIEAYDISNSGDSHITGGMIVLDDGRFAKRKYRSFNIQTDCQDDYAAMRETLERRLSHTESDWVHPDLILLDGGSNHVNVIKALMREKNITIPVFGMVKDEHHKTRTLTDGENEVSLTGRDDLFRFFYKIQEEVHRNAFEKMDAKRRKAVKSTSLTDIPGVGKVTADKLLKRFGGVAKIKTASETELIAAGFSRNVAKAVAEFYSSDRP